MAHDVYIADGAFDWSGGVDSNKVTTIQSELTPNGLKRSQLAWMNNATVRGQGILQRTGWLPLHKVHDGSAIFQGGFMYEPRNDVNPYFILSIGGHIYKYDTLTGAVSDLSVAFNEYMPANLDQSFFVQGEEFLVIQCGDGVTLPLFWDGVRLWRSKGITTTLVYPYAPGTNEIPAATCMDYFQNRIWYAQGRTYGAGDIVGNSSSGTVAYNYRDSILNVSENPLCFGGDNFTVPTNSGNIRALKHSANLNTDLGDENLYISTRKAIYSLSVPITRLNWIAADTNNMPKQRIAQLNNGWVNDRSVVASNGDLFGQSLEPSIRSLKAGIRNFDQWGNVPISSAEVRALQFNNRALMRLSSGIEFNNRLWQTILPRQIDQGVVHDAIAMLDFEILNTLEEQLPPAWEGIYEGHQVLQLFTGDFGGLERAFAAIVSRVDNSIGIWELTTDSRTDNEDARVVWSFETPAYNWGKEFEWKELAGCHLWVDKIFGTVEFRVEYRVDADPCWRFWHYQKICVARSCAEDGPSCPPEPAYPYPGPNQDIYREGYKWPLVLPRPKASCDSMGVRPTTIGYQFQVRVTVKGWCRIRGVLLYATKIDQNIYQGLQCG